MKITTQSSQETIELGKNFAKIIAATDTVILEGNLGGGKTTFVKGVLKGLGIRGIARSPSFTLI
ncbi:MAG: tRNA (adenosine(37)-N6)-threonylcarbamoyltransferase complex ATPase subunit type 1 TsaE, partial [Candidatus Omnitrophica bacterium]|nr:tRNA (adenosine(37)-N6)-threonylcarbamoyltransferase complex ATPase subunit type 1 TsaE [Candidatus Omnitrophota bacterium]